jgi:dTDP-4-amino-4,6-dideoxygalactose transaminase
MAVPFHRPFTGKEEEEAVLRVLRSGWLTTGAETLAFEKEFSEFLTRGRGGGARPPQCLAVNSATSGLHLALEALGVGPGDLVLLPSYTFTSTAEVARYLGAESVFVDIAPDSYNIDPAALEETLMRIKAGKAVPGWDGTKGGKPKALIVVHYGGLPCDMDAITEITRRHDLAVVEDAAHAFPAFYDGRDHAGWAGTLGGIGVFSFYATKTLTTGEGGMVVTGNEKTAKRIAIMRSHGIDRTVWNRYTDAKASWYYEVIERGFKYNLPDLLAAVGRVQLSRALDMLAMRQAIAARYNEAFTGMAEFIIPPTSPARGGDARHLYPLRLKNGAAITAAGTSRRDAFIEKLKEAGIGVSVHFIPLHVMPYYRNRYKLKAEDFPESYRRFGETLSLPLWPGMTNEETDEVIAAVTQSALIALKEA